MECTEKEDKPLANIKNPSTRWVTPSNVTGICFFQPSIGKTKRVIFGYYNSLRTQTCFQWSLLTVRKVNTVIIYCLVGLLILKVKIRPAMFDNYQEISHTRGLSTVPFYAHLDKQIYCAELCCAHLLIPRPWFGWLGQGGGERRELSCMTLFF